MRAVVEMKTADLQGFTETMVRATDEMAGGPGGGDR
jgi:hypothetical protein